MKNPLKTIVAVLLFALAPADSSTAADGEDVRFFENNIRPLLIESCLKCHGPKKSESGLRLDSREFMLKGGDSGPAIEPGESKESLLVKAARHEDGLEMPPGKKLSRLQIASLADWIDKGAVWPVGMTLGKGGPKLRGGPITDAERAHWSYQPIRDLDPPQVDSSRPVRNSIDRFLQAKLVKAGLSARSPASKRVLIRRATFDLTGLPPTPDEIAAFLKDESPEAFRKVVDRLLASKAYGERWGRHWLDVVRYADTAGDTADYPTPLSYKYRNWVINAFNKDKPYDQFIREQIAGDILAAQADGISEAEYRELLTATGFIAISRRFGFDVENYHHLTIQDTIDTLGQAVLGLTLGCARCHDHKYDPVNVDDYYAWYGIFESTRYSFPGSEEKKRPYDLFPALSAESAKRRKAEHDTRLVKIDEEIKQLNQLKESLAAKLKSSSRSADFAGFETQPLGASMMKPWGTLEDLQVVANAQSPFENVFVKGSRGLAMPNNAGNNAFGRPLAKKHTAKTTPKIYYNIDFKLTANSKEGGGAFRFYLGHGPGTSGAVELSASATQLFVKNGEAGYQPVADLKIGEWYNLQVTADLRARTYSGQLASSEKATSFAYKQFTPNWDGFMDRTFVDKYGALGGDIPARHFDNLSVRTVPFLPARKLIQKDSAEIAANRWQSYLEDRRLTMTSEDRDGHAGFDVWANDPLPIVGVSTAKDALKVPGTVVPEKVVVHPNPKEGVGIAWQSPFTGRVTISGRVADAHNCGDSVNWHLDHLGATGFQEIVSGSIATNSASPILLIRSQRNGGKGSGPVEIAVKEGEFFQLAVMPKAHYGCDLTQIDLTISEVGGNKRSWDLATDVKDDLIEGNPNDDRYGNSPWYFYVVAEDRGRSVNLKPLVVLTAEGAARVRKEIDTATAQVKSLTEDQAQLKRSGPYEVIYGAIEQDKPKNAQIRIRGDRYKLGEVVPRKNLEILGGNLLANPHGSGRAELAVWLTWKQNTLTPRVMANRIWQYHFGRGLVATANDFGTRGEEPSHPELLDWLATQFIEGGWSVKSMHRLIMNSAAYQQSSEFNATAAEADPDSRLLWRFNRRRLSAEEIRDAMLAVSGDLDRTAGGEHPFPKIESWGFSQHMPYYGVYPTNRRSVYLMQQRLKRHPFLSLFDGADVNVSTSRRELTTVPTQALYLMNSDFVHKRSGSLVAQILKREDHQAARLQRLFQSTLGRAATESELASAAQFLSEYLRALESGTQEAGSAEAFAWSAYARTILTRNEFLFVD